MHTKKTSISILSPVHIGCGEDYEPTNFVIKDSLLYYLDLVSLADELSVAEKLSLGNFINLQATQEFFQSKRDRLAPLSIHMVDVAKEIADKFEDKKSKQSQSGEYSQDLMARTSFNPLDSSAYIPGSSLKGSMRTAWLNSKIRELGNNKFKDLNSKALQDSLLSITGKGFENDPFRHLKVTDALHGKDSEPVPTQIIYALSKKKIPSDRNPKEGLNVRLESIHHLIYDAFEGEILFTEDLSKKAIDHQINWEKLCDACNDFYFPQLQNDLDHQFLSSMLDKNWRKLMNDLFCNELNELRNNHQGFLLRLGKNSGAESLTLDGYRSIKILGKNGYKDATFRPETTEKRFASLKKNAQDGLLPFGWVWVESCEDEFQYLSISMRKKLTPYSSLIREKQRERLFNIHILQEQRKQEVFLREEKIKKDRLEAIQKAKEEEDRLANLAKMSLGFQAIEILRSKIEAEVLKGKKINTSNHFWGEVKKTVEMVLSDSSWSSEEKKSLADMLEDWGIKLFAIELKELRKKLNISALKE
jgi:CRISPR-associated protein Csm5